MSNHSVTPQSALQLQARRPRSDVAGESQPAKAFCMLK